MFSFRRDKMGFINGLILMSIVGVTVLSTVLLWAIWGWDQCGTAIKVIWGTAWVLCIIAVLVRINVFKYQRHRAERSRSAGEPGEAISPASERPATAKSPRSLSEEARDGPAH